MTAESSVRNEDLCAWIDLGSVPGASWSGELGQPWCRTQGQREGGQAGGGIFVTSASLVLIPRGSTKGQNLCGRQQGAGGTASLTLNLWFFGVAPRPSSAPALSLVAWSPISKAPGRFLPGCWLDSFPPWLCGPQSVLPVPRLQRCAWPARPPSPHHRQASLACGVGPGCSVHTL